MKKFVSIMLALAMSMSLAACGADSSSDASSDSQSSSDAASGEKVVKIGVFEPATGDSGAGGKQEMLGMQYANHMTPTVDIGGETYKVELVYADNGSDSAKAPTAASELVSKDVSLVLGTYGSSCAMAGGPIFGEAGLAAIGVTCTNPQVTSDCSVYYRICFLDPFQGTVLANYAYKELGVTTAYTLAMLGSDYDQGLVYYFTEAFKALGGEVVSEDFPEGNANFVSYINNAKSADAGVIFAPVSTNYAQLIIEAASAQGFEGHLLGSDTWDDNMVLQAAKGTNVQVFVSTFYAEGGNKTFDDGIKAYINGNADAKTTNGGDDTISAVTAMGYDVYYVALEALKAAGSTDPAKVMEALPGVTYDGVSGHIAFDETGDAIRDTAYIKTIDTAANVWKFVTQQKAS